MLNILIAIAGWITILHGMCACNAEWNGISTMIQYQILFNVRSLSGIVFLIMAILILLFVFHLDKKFRYRDSKLVYINSVISTAYQKEKWHRFLTFMIFLLLTAISAAVVITFVVITVLPL